MDPTLMIVFFVLLIGMIAWQQWQSRRRQKKKMEEMNVGNEVMTIGGIIGRLTHLDSEEKRARIEISPGVEIQIVLEAISRTLPPPESYKESEEEDTSEVQ